MCSLSASRASRVGFLLLFSLLHSHWVALGLVIKPSLVFLAMADDTVPDLAKVV